MCGREPLCVSVCVCARAAREVQAGLQRGDQGGDGDVDEEAGNLTYKTAIRHSNLTTRGDCPCADRLQRPVATV